MKKSLVITTIATVLVIVVALTTATFAWFSTSATTTVSGEYTVSTGGGDFRIFAWDKATSDYGVDATYALDIATFGNSYNFDTDTMGGTLTDTTINPTLPIGTLDGIFNGMTSNNFIAATQETSGVNVTDYQAKPIYAKFLLNTKLDTTNLKITINITSTNVSRATIYAINNLNFVLIGKSATDSAATQSFVIGTTYSYYDGAVSAEGVIATATYEAAVKSETVEAYSERNLSDYANVVNNDFKTNLQAVTLDSFRTGVDSTPNKVALTSDAIAMTSATEIECVLFVWFDGDEMTESASDGGFKFEISFAKQA